MKKSILSTIALSAILSAGLTLQSCSDTRTETTYSSEPYASADYEGPVETRTTTTYTTTDDDHDSVVGSTAHAAGTIIAAPFRLVGDALSIVF
jgi:hypothetical protein